MLGGIEKQAASYGCYTHVWREGSTAVEGGGKDDEKAGGGRQDGEEMGKRKRVDESGLLLF